MDEPTKQHHVHTEAALGQLSIQENDQGAFTNGCREDIGDVELGRAGPRTFFGKGMRYWVMMVASSAALMVGQSAAVVLGRYYYVHGGSRRWVFTWILSMGWPVFVLPLVVFCCCKREAGGGIRSLLHALCPTHASRLKMCFIYAGLGAMTFVDNLLYSFGTSYLPVSTYSLLCSSQLVFTAVFSYLLVHHKMTGYVLNSIFIITTATVLLGVSSSSDKPAGTSNGKYIIGFVVTVAASALVALLFPLYELLFKVLAKQTKSCAAAFSHELDASPIKPMVAQKLPSEQYTEISTTTAASSAIRSFLLALEVQTVVNIIASVFAFVAMCINGDLAAMREEAQHFDKGVLAYVMCLAGSGIGWQLCCVGASAVIILSSALMACAFSTAMIPILPVLGVIVFHDSFLAVKGIAMMLSVWGFMSYIYDGYLAQRNGSTDQS